MNSRMDKNKDNYQTSKANITKKEKTAVKKNPKKRKKVKQTKKVVNKEPKKRKKIRIKYKNVFIAAFILIIIGAILYFFYSLPITNIYIKNNSLLTDQEIIEKAGLNNYPSAILVNSYQIKKNLTKNPLIENVKVKRIFRKIELNIIENYPLYYNLERKKTILLDGREVDATYSNVPVLINYVPDTVSKHFFTSIQKINRDVLKRISEIKYDKDEVDNERFLLSMRDGNYVYITLAKIDSLNSYISIIREFPNKKGILYLNAGNSFDVIEE